METSRKGKREAARSQHHAVASRQERQQRQQRAPSHQQQQQPVRLSVDSAEKREASGKKKEASVCMFLLGLVFYFFFCFLHFFVRVVVGRCAIFQGRLLLASAPPWGRIGGGLWVGPQAPHPVVCVVVFVLRPPRGCFIACPNPPPRFSGLPSKFPPKNVDWLSSRLFPALPPPRALSLLLPPSSSSHAPGSIPPFSCPLSAGTSLPAFPLARVYEGEIDRPSHATLLCLYTGTDGRPPGVCSLSLQPPPASPPAHCSRHTHSSAWLLPPTPARLLLVLHTQGARPQGQPARALARSLQNAPHPQNALGSLSPCKSKQQQEEKRRTKNEKTHRKR